MAKAMMMDDDFCKPAGTGCSKAPTPFSPLPMLKNMSMMDDDFCNRKPSFALLSGDDFSRPLVDEISHSHLVFLPSPTASFASPTPSISNTMEIDGVGEAQLPLAATTRPSRQAESSPSHCPLPKSGEGESPAWCFIQLIPTHHHHRR